MVYWSKAEVLVALGKNSKDVRYLDRAIARGEVVVEGGGYIIMKEYVDNLQWKVKDLEREKAELEKMLGERSTSIIQAKSVLDDGEVAELKGKVVELERIIIGLENDKKELEGKVHDLTMEGNTSSESTSSDSDLDFQIQENERLEGEKKELIEGVKKTFYKYCSGGNWETFKQTIGLSSLLEDVYLEE